MSSSFDNPKSFIGFWLFSLWCQHSLSSHHDLLSDLFSPQLIICFMMLRCRWGEWWCEIWGIRTTLKKSFPFLPRPNCWHIWIEIDCRSILVSCMNAIIWFLFPIVQRWAFGKRRNPVLAIKSLVSAWRFISLWKQPRHNDQSLSRAFFIAGKGIMPRLVNRSTFVSLQRISSRPPGRS